MNIDVDGMAEVISQRIANGDNVVRTATDGVSAEFESTAEQARALKVLQEIQAGERRRKKVVPGFFGLQTFQNRGLTNGID